MKVAVFSAKRYDRVLLTEANRSHGHALTFQEAMLGPDTVVLAAGYPACLLYTSPSPRDLSTSRMPSSA